MTQTVHEWLYGESDDLSVEVHHKSDWWGSRVFVNINERPVFRLVVQYDIQGSYPQIDFLDEAIELDTPIDEVINGGERCTD